MKKLADIIELARFASGKTVAASVRGHCDGCDAVLPGGTTGLCGGCDTRHRDPARYEALRRMEKSIPGAYRDCRFGSERLAFITQARIDAVSASKSRGLVVSGPAGYGKTTLAVAKLYQLFDEGARACFFVSAPDLATARRVHPLGDGDAPVVKRAMNTAVLVVDDLGKEKQDLSGVVSEVIFHRHANGKRTIVTCSFGVDEARAAYDDGIARRLFEEDWIILGGKKQ